MSGMTLDQLRIFLAVAENMHFTRAAEALYLTQPAVSAAIQSLEEEYRVKLFDRIGRHIEITEAGQFLQTEAQKILEYVGATERGLRELNNLQRGELRLGASLTLGNYWLPNTISYFKRLYPGIFVNCTLANAEEICEKIVLGKVDLGLIAGEVKPSLKKNLDQEVVGSDCLKIVVGKSHPWFERKEISLTELITGDWVMRESGSGTQQMFEQSLRNRGIDTTELNVILVLCSSEMVKAAVENGVGVAAIPELMVKKELELGTLHSLLIIDDRENLNESVNIIRPILKLKHKQRFQTRISKVFEEMLIHTTYPKSA